MNLGHELESTKSALVALILCLVRTIEETDESFGARFIRRLNQTAQTLADDGADISELEIFALVEELLDRPASPPRQGAPLQKPD